MALLSPPPTSPTSQVPSSPCIDPDGDPARGPDITDNPVVPQRDRNPRKSEWRWRPKSRP
eukprot:3034962-Rhodomonas_salina.1